MRAQWHQHHVKMAAAAAARSSSMPRHPHHPHHPHQESYEYLPGMMRPGSRVGIAADLGSTTPDYDVIQRLQQRPAPPPPPPQTAQNPYQVKCGKSMRLYGNNFHLCIGFCFAGIRTIVSHVSDRAPTAAWVGHVSPPPPPDGDSYPGCLQGPTGSPPDVLQLVVRRVVVRTPVQLKPSVVRTVSRPTPAQVQLLRL